MQSSKEHIELVGKAQLGDRDALERLAEEAQLRLHQYVLRLTMQEELTQDIVQESVLEMFRVFKKLKKAERFWSWLYGIAFNKVRGHYAEKWRHKTVSFSQAGYDFADGDREGALAEMVNREFRQIVLTSMRELAPRHRAVLTMRCYDQMPYSQIAELMGCTEFGARALFFRAKKALARRLSIQGLGRGSLLAALIFFGKATATSEVAAANIAVTASTVKVGLAAAAAATVTSKTVVISATAAAMVVAGSAMITSQAHDKTPAHPEHNATILAPDGFSAAKTPAATEECWYFFPQGREGPVMVRMMKGDASGKDLRCKYLQNQHANYYQQDNSIIMENHRTYSPDLSVTRLPVDSKPLSDFLSEVEGRAEGMELISEAYNGLLVVCKRAAGRDSRIWRIDRHLNVLEEEYFQVDWPASMRIVDNRDKMHRRGWTCFTIAGRVDGQRITGSGRIAFIHEAAGIFYPWLRLRVGDSREIVDTGRKAVVRDISGRTLAGCPGGSFFKGLARPWMGLHTIDTIRRDAAEKQIRFDTKSRPRQGKAEVTLACGNVSLVYVIDLANDLLEKITWIPSDCGGAGPEGEITFTYLQELDLSGDEFAEPEHISVTRRQEQSPGPLWLANLTRNLFQE